MEEKDRSCQFLNSHINVDGVSWNDSVKAITLLYHWGMLNNYESVLRTIYLHQKWGYRKKFKADNNFLMQATELLPEIGGPRIWACFHIGAYGLLARALIKKGCGIAILLKDEVFEEQYPIYVQQFKESFGREPRDTELCFIRTNGAKSLIKLKKCIVEGYHVVGYIDAYEGVGEAKGTTKIRLFDKTMDVRVGMAALSYWTGVAVRPIVLTTKHNQLRVYSRQDIHVDAKENYGEIMQYCFDILESLPVDELIQWEFLPDLSERLVAQFPNVVPKTSIWLPIEAVRENRLFDVVSRKSVTVSASNYAKIKEILADVLVKM